MTFDFPDWTKSVSTGQPQSQYQYGDLVRPKQCWGLWESVAVWGPVLEQLGTSREDHEMDVQQCQLRLGKQQCLLVEIHGSWFAASSVLQFRLRLCM